MLAHMKFKTIGSWVTAQTFFPINLAYIQGDLIYLGSNIKLKIWQLMNLLAHLF